ncbi:MAG: T9SS type A sorting domain-containing protein [Bacteroidetes bacterium]|nr:T9SS type A sorting domain-containing protein [Bacteroidota bacterium]
MDGITENESCQIIIYDINGRQITELQLTENRTPKMISLSLINSGIYFYKAISGDKVVQNKLVIIK